MGFGRFARCPRYRGIRNAVSRHIPSIIFNEGTVGGGICSDPEYGENCGGKLSTSAAKHWKRFNNMLRFTKFTCLFAKPCYSFGGKVDPQDMMNATKVGGRMHTCLFAPLGRSLQPLSSHAFRLSIAGAAGNPPG